MQWISEVLPPRQTPSIWRKLNPFWALFGNEDDGYFGDERWRAGREKTFGLAVRWWVRNPFHNLFFYVIGVADKPRTFWSVEGRGWGEVDGWTFHWLQAGGSWLKLPLASYKSKRISAYAGWRPYGAFGLKFQLKRQGR